MESKKSQFKYMTFETDMDARVSKIVEELIHNSDRLELVCKLIGTLSNVNFDMIISSVDSARIRNAKIQSAQRITDGQTND